MMDLQSLPHFKEIESAAERVAHTEKHLVGLCVQVQQIPAPTGEEKARADWVERHFRQLGLRDVYQDEVYNVYGRLQGERPAPALLVSAHTDTVFPLDTDLAIQRDVPDRIAGPGIGDNSAGVAGLLVLADTLKLLPPPPVDIWLVANSNEEGLGDLRGMRAAMDHVGDKAGRVGAAIVLEGMGLGRIVHRALGVRRYRISATAPGGHSWGDFGTASAIHALAVLAAEITRMRVPKEPRTSFNIGKIWGGTSINTIAQQAGLELDLRSADPATLDRIDQYVQALVQRHQESHDRYQNGVHFHVEAIGNRPAGEISDVHPMVQALSQIMARLGIVERHDVRVSSTDANVPLSQGIPAVCIGLTEGGDAHRLTEWINTGPLVKGVQQLLTFVWWTAVWLTTGDRR